MVPPARRHEILKDPRHGTYAVVGMFVAGLLWYVSLAALAPARYPALLAFAGALSRAAAVSNAFVFPYARAGDVSRAFARRPAILPIGLTFGALAIGGFLLWRPLAAVVAIALGCSLLGGRAIAKSLGGGLVGDAYGFLIVAIEIALTVVFAAAGARID